MPTLKLPQPLRTYTRGESLLQLNGDTVREMLDDLTDTYPDLKPHLYTKKGKLAAFVHLFLHEEGIRNQQGLDTPLYPDDELILVPSISGGA
jgi:molybdopterin converting factor small subunit